MSGQWEIEADEDGDFYHIGPMNEFGALALSIARTQDERAAHLIAAAPELKKCAENLIFLIEGVVCSQWSDQSGRRLKDTTEWAEFYVAAKEVK